MNLLEHVTDEARPSWTSFKIDPEGLDAAHLLQVVESCVPGGSHDSGVVGGVLHFAVRTDHVDSVVGRMETSTEKALHEIARLITDAMTSDLAPPSILEGGAHKICYNYESKKRGN